MHLQRSIVFVSLCVGLVFSGLARAQTYHCNHTSTCYNGACCGFSDGEGVCGYGDSWCGDTCISNCDAKAECGKDAEDPSANCPLNVCCSPFGFCGTTEEFCGKGCQGDNCGDITRPSCQTNDVFKTKIGYYESWASGRSCDGFRPNDIAVSSLTHINYAFAEFEPNNADNTSWEFELMEDGVNEPKNLVEEFIGLKKKNPSLSCYISVGGWSFEDPPRQLYWSEMAATSKGRKSFSKNLLEFMQKYGFDGVDLDWEYPVASERGGMKDDKDNYVLLIKALREEFDDSGESYGITFTTPSSYWYLQHFDVPGMLDAGADWTNVMSYDLHGVWDKNDDWIGSVMHGHTNMTEIIEALDLFWRVGVDPSKVVMGVAFYGRSFTMSDTSCISPGCAFSGAGTAGPCTNSPGTLSYKEITEAIDEYSAVTFYDEDDAVEYAIFDDDQWVSYDTNVTFKQKIRYANKVCLGGIMIWSVDQDTYKWDAMTALLDKDVSSDALVSGSTDSKERADKYAAYTGTNCYITDCAVWNSGQCKDGYSVLDYVHKGERGVIDDPDDELCKTGAEGDRDAEYRLICCPTDAMPEGCAWRGTSDDGVCTGGESDTCGDSSFELVADTYMDRTGDDFCSIGKRSLCCNENPELTKCHWTPCNPSEDDFDDWTSDIVSFYGGTNTYKNCEWKHCVESCPNDKVLISQRREIGHNTSMLTSDCSPLQTHGINMLCCDPPDAADSAPVDPKKLFKYPDEDDVSYYYNVEKSSNDADTDDESTDPFAFVMIDGDVDSYSESLVDKWSFLTDEGTLSKRNLKFHKRDHIFEYREDTFDNAVEVYHVRCTSDGCDDIFKGGAPSTIVKMPTDIGAGPYARVVSLTPWGSSTQNLKPRSADEEYEMTVDYDFKAASPEKKGNVNFRVDYTNLQEYWNEITDAPASSSRKRWYGSFDDWLAKMTTIVQDEVGSLPLEFEETMKLYHAEKYCPKLNINATFDIDASIKLGLDAQYGYYFEGAILPTPSLIASYGYFSIHPAAAILLTLRAEAVMQSNSDRVELLSAGFPGLSIKGLISVGPELSLNGQLDASLKVSGELNAGVSVGWERTEFYFPQDVAAKKADIAPKDLKDDDQTFSFEPVFDAQLTAEGNMALTLTPEVRFGISVLGGDLMSGQVTAGIDNTISMGINATAHVDKDGNTGAGFCYWADFVYTIFLRADMNFIGDLAYWGDRLDVASPKDPLVLVDQTCQTYSSDDAKSKRDDSDPGTLVEKTDKKACFGGLIACSDTEEDSCSASDDDGGNGDDNTDSKVSKRAASCDRPAFWYNCDFFGDQWVPNHNPNVAASHVAFKGICSNIRDYLQTHNGPGIGNNWMNLDYKDAAGNTNRGAACGQAGPDSTKACAEKKRALWSTAAQHAFENDPNGHYHTQGWSESISCDEFPSNRTTQGGTGASTACTPKEQQDYQKVLNGIIPRIRDTTFNKQAWGDYSGAWGGKPRSYTVNLMYGHQGNAIGTKGGHISQNSPYPVAIVLGGVNLLEIPHLTLKKTARSTAKNSVCQIEPTQALDEADNIYKYEIAACDVTYVDSANPTKRNVDDWEIESITLPDDWKETAISVSKDDPEGLAQAFFEQLDIPDNSEKEAHVEHLSRHKRSHSHDHGHKH
ncbi:hypothetical protein N7536_001048 [Penicillium majusculum]|nr:hypothetical protein N7536_001048 [Penicillium majusculum]